MSQRWIAIALVVIAAVLIIYGGFLLHLDTGNKRAFLAMLGAGGCTTVAAWVWARMTAAA